jgi:hypothetical protein
MGAPLFAEQTGNGHDGVSFTHTAGYAFHQSSCPRAPEENGWLTFSKTAAAHAESAARTAVRRSRSVGAPQSASKAVAGTGVRFVIGGERAAQSRAVAKRSFGAHHPKKAPPRGIFGSTEMYTLASPEPTILPVREDQGAYICPWCGLFLLGT